MSNLKLTPQDRQSIDFAEEERKKSQTRGAVVHNDDIKNLADNNLSNVSVPKISLGSVSKGTADKVIERFVSSDGNTWYKKYASGWIEQGGIFTCQGTSSGQTVVFPLEFPNKALGIILTMANGSYNSTACIGKVLSVHAESDRNLKRSFGCISVSRAGNYEQHQYNYYAYGY
jgi:hypothetical protein